MTPTDPPTVLVVDDERNLADMLALFLPGDYDVLVAYGGVEAPEQVDDTVDVVLLDRRMPGLSGDEVLAEMRARGLNPAVAMLTAVEPDVEVLDMDFDEYMVKPVFKDDVRETVEVLVNRLAYDRRLRQLFSLVSKRAVLFAAHSESELEASQEYVDLESRIEKLRGELDEQVAGFADVEFDGVFRSPNEVNS